MRTRTGWTALVLLVPVVLAGCGSEEGPDDPALRLPISDVRVAVDEPAWMVGETLHVDGREVRTGVAAESFTLVQDGALLLKATGCGSPTRVLPPRRSATSAPRAARPPRPRRTAGSPGS